ncbi:segregation/condensation protein A [Leptolyngbya sp. FACHB-711]|uniref:segregation/condensation protein A n=1 Tax=unclassified Leptolyngbya TaxID=2650499 RepID=UPI001685E042|nr:segregation/condensation protein A [Leptolyngbya sp. FACHB-711]MBD1850543.1 segregation/condensation protein A [Cyanobacteria bacterium FACHB-502]MBD2026759.1 segregation/condensation protein A [Leptolyngbya sp. FACHB-711]
MSLSLAQNAISFLIELAERGEINPWDVQVIEVIDRFLSKLKPDGGTASPGTIAANGRAPYEADLSQSGQAFLYASMLLLLKADSLAREASAEPPPEEELADDFEPCVNPGLPPHLERRIRRRATAPPIPSRRVTLPELITQLNLIAAAIAEPKTRRVVARRARPHSQKQAIRTIAQLAHQENLSEVAAILEQFLTERWQELSQGDEWLNFEQLLYWWREVQPDRSAEESAPNASHMAHSETSDRVGVFWALLLLSAQSKVELSQQVFYEDLNVRSLTPALLSEGTLPAFVLPD